MSRYGLLSCLAFFLAGCATAYTPPPLLPNDLRIAPEVVFGMLEIQSNYKNETARCLTGYINEEIVYVQSMHPVRILYQSPIEVYFEPCQSQNTVGWYHNHPQDDAGNAFCGLDSAPDLETLNFPGNSFYISIITCDEKHIVYRFKMQEMVYYFKVEFDETP